MNSNTKQIIFIDTRVANYQTLIADLPADTEVILINGGNGLQQMADALAGRSGIDAIHVFSHGSAGALRLGDTTLNSDTLNTYAPLLAQIGQSLTAEGDLLLYGCNVAQGEAGQAFVESIARITQADVAASNDLTGNAALGGDWLLETVSGDVSTPVAVSPTLAANYQGVLVDTTFDFTSGTVIQAGGAASTDDAIYQDATGTYQLKINGATRGTSIVDGRVFDAATLADKRVLIADGGFETSVTLSLVGGGVFDAW
jgi:hypothetical protein